MLLEMADELFDDNSLSDLGHERQVGNWMIIVQVTGVEVGLRFFQKQCEDGVLL